MQFVIVLTLVIGAGAHRGDGWDNAELEMFDLVEEVGQNFYEVFELPKDAGLKEIKSSYRRLSVKFHPDKNPDPDAATKFRQIVGIYEVLKDTELRLSYHRVLEEGLPNWKQPIYYYRRYRKLSVWQVVVLVTILVSAAQYLAAWASWVERRWSVQEAFSAKLRQKTRKRKQQKDGKTEEDLKAQMDQFLEKPSLWNILPFQTLRFFKYLVTAFPTDMIQLYRQIQDEKVAQEKLRLAELEEAEAAKLAAEEPRKPKKRKVFVAPEKPEGEEESEIAQSLWTSETVGSASATGISKPPVVSGGLWTDEDLGELAKLCSKFPGGTPKRWEVIGDLMGRPVAEVTFMAKKVLDGLKKSSNQAAGTSTGADDDESSGGGVKVKVKTKGGKGDSMDRVKVENWNADEQKALESALAAFPKGSTERWERIAASIPGRSKEECMQRFKYVADLVKKKREEETESVQVPEPVAPVAIPPKVLVAPDEPQLDESDYIKKKGRGKKGLVSSQTQGLRKRDLRRQMSTSSSSDSESPADQDWCLVEGENDNEET